MLTPSVDRSVVVAELLPRSSTAIRPRQRGTPFRISAQKFIYRFLSPADGGHVRSHVHRGDSLQGLPIPHRVPRYGHISCVRVSVATTRAGF